MKNILKRIKEWEFYSRAIIVIQFLILVWGVPVSIHQLKEIRNNQLSRSYTLATNYYDKLTTSRTGQLSLAIYHKKPLLLPKGKFTEDDLDNYLGYLHDIGIAFDNRIITPNDICSNFWDLTLKAKGNSELENYLSKIRKTDPTYYTGYDTLYSVVKSCR